MEELSIQELKKLRQANKISQKRIAAYMGVSEDTIARHERLLMKSSLDFLKRYKAAIEAVIEAEISGKSDPPDTDWRNPPPVKRFSLALLEKELDEALVVGEKYDLSKFIIPHQSTPYKEVLGIVSPYFFEKKIGSLYQFRHIAGGYTVTLSAPQLMNKITKWRSNNE